MTFVAIDPNQLGGIDQLLIATLGSRKLSLLNVFRDGSTRLSGNAVDLGNRELSF
jgi:hypothetical protein